MTLLDQYLLKKILLPFFYCVSGFVSVWLIWDLSTNLPDFVTGFNTLGFKSTLLLVVNFYLLQIPSVMMLSVPVGLLLALLYTLTQMSRRNEIISMLCAGQSLYRIFLPLVLVGLVMTGLLTCLNYALAPQAGAVRDDLKDEIKSGVKKQKGLVNHLFRNREDHRLWFFTWLNTRTDQALRVEIIQQNAAGVVSEMWYGGHAYYLNDKKSWVLQEARHILVDEAGNLTFSETLPQLEIKGWNETPWKIASSTMNSEFLSFPDLSDYLRFNAEFPPERLAPFLTGWYYRLALPWICLVVIFIAGPMGVVIGRRGIMGGVGTAIGLFATYLFTSSLFLALGKGDRIPAWLAAWGPNLIFLTIGFYLFWIKATGREYPKFRLPGF
jgi:lipopolysaccharide export LptBFGC system permease protein LptF